MSTTYAPRGIYSCHKLARPSLAFSRISTCQQSVRPSIRVFTTSPWRRKDDTRVKPVTQETKVAAAEPTKTATVKKERVDPLLAEQTVSNKEQRKADWAIIKDMAHYLWPKDDFGTRFRVGLSVALLVGAKVKDHFPYAAGCHVNGIQGSERPSSLLFQVHCRFYEHRLCCCRWHCCHRCWCHYLRM
jgi:ATP-binding cassette subfamily B (MDR/TAP) protein 7